MKNNLYILIILIYTGTAKGSMPDSIPNAGFEEWITNSWFDNPSEWSTNNTQLLAPTIYKDTDSYSGNYAMLLGYYGALQPKAWCDFPLLSHPLNLGGYVKNQMSSGDSLIIVIRVYYNQQIVDSGYSILYGGINPSYSPFLVPISQNSTNADSCQISFEGVMSFQTTISFDNIQFDFSMGVPFVEKSRVSFFPNPCQEYVILKVDQGNFYPIFVEAFDIIGKQSIIPVDKNGSDGYIVKLNTSTLSAGLWNIILYDNKQILTVMLLKN